MRCPRCCAHFTIVAQNADSGGGTQRARGGGITSRSRARATRGVLLADAEPREDVVQEILGGLLSGDFLERAGRFLQIEQRKLL
jgi:hypothetical protein